MKKEDSKIEKIIIIGWIIFFCVIYIVYSITGKQNAKNEVATNTIEEVTTNKAENIVEEDTITEPKYVTKMSFANPDVFYNKDYTTRKYIEYIVEEDGTYLIETSEKVGATYLVYIVDKPILDLATYDGYFEMIQHTANEHKTIEKELKKGQYVYVVQGDSKIGSAYIKERE